MAYRKNLPVFSWKEEVSNRREGRSDTHQKFEPIGREPFGWGTNHEGKVLSKKVCCSKNIHTTETLSARRQSFCKVARQKPGGARGVVLANVWPISVTEGFSLQKIGGRERF